jgi:uncharacterized protein YheU (UPF0270 family)
MIEQRIPKHPIDPDQTLDEVLHDIVARNGFDRKLFRYEIKQMEVVLTYQEPN